MCIQCSRQEDRRTRRHEDGKTERKKNEQNSNAMFKTDKKKHVEKYSRKHSTSFVKSLEFMREWKESLLSLVLQYPEPGTLVSGLRVPWKDYLSSINVFARKHHPSVTEYDLNIQKEKLLTTRLKGSSTGDTRASVMNALNQFETRVLYLFAEHPSRALEPSTRSNSDDNNSNFDPDEVDFVNSSIDTDELSEDSTKFNSTTATTATIQEDKSCLERVYEQFEEIRKGKDESNFRDLVRLFKEARVDPTDLKNNMKQVRKSVLSSDAFLTLNSFVLAFNAMGIDIESILRTAITKQAKQQIPLGSTILGLIIPNVLNIVGAVSSQVLPSMICNALEETLSSMFNASVRWFESESASQWPDWNVDPVLLQKAAKRASEVYAAMNANRRVPSNSKVIPTAICKKVVEALGMINSEFASFLYKKRLSPKSGGGCQQSSIASVTLYESLEAMSSQELELFSQKMRFVKCVLRISELYSIANQTGGSGFELPMISLMRFSSSSDDEGITKETKQSLENIILDLHDCIAETSRQRIAYSSQKLKETFALQFLVNTIGGSMRLSSRIFQKIRKISPGAELLMNAFILRPPSDTPIKRAYSAQTLALIYDIACAIEYADFSKHLRVLVRDIVKLMIDPAVRYGVLMGTASLSLRFATLSGLEFLIPRLSSEPPLNFASKEANEAYMEHMRREMKDDRFMLELWQRIDGIVSTQPEIGKAILTWLLHMLCGRDEPDCGRRYCQGPFAGLMTMFEIDNRKSNPVFLRQCYDFSDKLLSLNPTLIRVIVSALNPDPNTNEFLQEEFYDAEEAFQTGGGSKDIAVLSKTLFHTLCDILCHLSEYSNYCDDSGIVKAKHLLNTMSLFVNAAPILSQTQISTFLSLYLAEMVHSYEEDVFDLMKMIVSEPKSMNMRMQTGRVVALNTMRAEPRAALVRGGARKMKSTRKKSQ
jgi:hypothetical protein